MRTDSPPIRLSLVAPNGRMGRAIDDAVNESEGFVIGQGPADVLIDFSAPAALPASLARAVSESTPILIGTTGLDDLAIRQLEEAARRVAVLHAPNTSLGVALLKDLVERTARVLSPQWDIEVLEVHHRAKLDAPSGTALMLAEAARRGRAASVDAERDSDVTNPNLEPHKIGFAALRGGTVAGDHDVLFLGPDERLILSHRAESRDLFARGALEGARFLHGRRPGLYGMRDVISEA